MMSDLSLFDLVYVVVGTGCLIGLLILTHRPEPPPVSVRARARIRQHSERDEQR